ncbi:ribonuclease H-like domain-containing protein [Cunninghamella echinulata]|nr:ribonuclease H-like domain-containing protein [Cunninghamella echinulata]
MEISRKDFIKKVPIVKEAIDECDFMAIDTELSGLHRPFSKKRFDTLENRYKEYKEATERFVVIQFGLCTFKWDNPSGRYIAKAFNFYIFPTSITGKSQTNRIFQVQAQAFDFLSKQAFDFNKWIYQGIPYLTAAEEEKVVKDGKKLLNDEIPDIPVDEKELPFITKAKQDIQNWLDKGNSKDKHGINIETNNSYQRRLLYQEIRKSFEGLTAEGKKGFICVMKLTEKEQKKRFKERERSFRNDLETAIGFRRVIDLISESKKPLIGHNMLLDMCHIIGQFIQELPDTREEFINLAHQLFPIMIDTKYIAATTPEMKKVVSGATDLENLRYETSRDPFKNPRIDMHWEYPRYLTDKAHEAGYDAYITGTVFIKMLSYLESKRNPKKEPFDNDDKNKEQEKSKNKENMHYGSWSDDDDDEEDNKKQEANSNWDTTEEEVYNYGSTFVKLLDENGHPVSTLANLCNRVVIAKTAFQYFSFMDRVADITSQPNTFILHAEYSTIQQDIFSNIGTYSLENLGDDRTLIIFDQSLIDKDSMKRLLIDEFQKITNQDILIDTITDYLNI